MAVLAVMGADSESYKREHRRAARLVSSETYSPPTVTTILSGMPGHALAPGVVLDLACTDPYDGLPCDFDKPEKRQRARTFFREQRPMVLIGSPMWTAWSTWQRLNKHTRDPAVVAEEMVKARVHLDFVMRLYREQLEEGRLFIHEHPLHAASWMEECVQELLACNNVGQIHADQCHSNIEAMHGREKGAPLTETDRVHEQWPEDPRGPIPSVHRAQWDLPPS